VREYSTPPTYAVPDLGNLTDDVVRNADERGDSVVLSRRVGAEWQDVTASDFLAEVVATAKGLVASGVEPGDRVALLSRTRYEWTLLDYAIWFAGAITVPVYDTSSTEQIRWILSDSTAGLIVAETPDHRARVEESRAELPHLGTVLCIDDGDVDKLVAAGTDVADEEIERRRTSLTPDSVATLIYTSGTTGRPKGCELTHGNFMFELGVAVLLLDELFETEGASTLLFLPLAHVFARIIQIGCIKQGTRMGHSADIKSLVDDLAAFQPTFILAVPRVFERVFNTASQKAIADGKGRIFHQAASVAVSYSQALDRSGPGPLLRLRHSLFDRLVYGRLRAALGGRTTYAVSGGAPLGERLAHFFRGIGVTVLEGYGLTETTAALTVNVPGAMRIGTVGKPLPGTSVRLTDDGELLFKGGQVFPGYWQNEQATAETLDSDGWLHSGDVGEIDDDGYVRITGRKKEIIVTAGGKNVAPTVLEDKIRAHELISQAMVVGDGKPFVGALITLDADALDLWRERNGRSESIDVLVNDADLLAEVQGAVDAANAAVSRAEAVRRFTILAVDWTEATGELTPTLKLKRSLVMRRYYDQVEALYL
jgi:long-chain acyl-CoA synthetase